MRRKIFLIMVLVFIPGVLGYPFGTVVDSQSRTSDGNATFLLEMVNPGNETLEILLSSDGFESGEVQFRERQFDFEPSEVSDNPKGSGWMSIETGKYARMTEIPVYALGAGEGKDRFTLRVEARLKDQDLEGAIQQRVVQVREYELEVVFPDEEAPLVGRGFDKDQNNDGPIIIRPENEDDEQEVNESSSQTNLSESTDNSSSAEVSNTTDTLDSSEPSGVSGLTMVLGMAAVASVAYLWMVI